MNIGTIVEIPFLVKAIIIWYMVILEVLLIFLVLERNTTIDHRLVFVLLVYYHTRCYKVT